MTTPLNKLKGFFRQNLNEQISNRMSESSMTNDSSEVKALSKKDEQTYEDWGFDMSKKQQGNENAFFGCWGLVKEYYTRKEKSNVEKQEEEKNKATSELEKRNVEKQQKQSIIDGLARKIENAKEKITVLHKDIFRIKENPESVVKDNASFASFIIGLIILLGLTIYLFIFYSSAAYSALFKDFTPDDDKVAQAIFDGQAISKAAEHGNELFFILAIPFAFLGLGYLIHKFQETEGIGKYFKIGFLIAITFVFDAILAYEIVEKIYEIKRAGSFTEMPEFTMEMAVRNVNFWVIIFAGFVVYLIWGFVFDFTMEAYSKINVVNQAIKNKESEIKLLEEDIKKYQQEIDGIQESIHKIEIELMDFQKVLNGEVFIINWSKFYQCVNEFTNGWTEWMTANRFDKILINQIHSKNGELIEQHKIEISKRSELLNGKQ